MKPFGRTRFLLGFALGAALVGPGFRDDPLAVHVCGTLFAGLLAGILAVRRGDAFWRRLGDRR